MSARSEQPVPWGVLGFAQINEATSPAVLTVPWQHLEKAGEDVHDMKDVVLDCEVPLAWGNSSAEAPESCRLVGSTATSTLTSKQRQVRVGPRRGVGGHIWLPTRTGIGPGGPASERW